MHYDHKTDRVVLPIRELISMALMGGDIDTRRPPSASRRARRGALTLPPSAAKDALPLSTASTPTLLSLTATCEGMRFFVEGQADSLRRATAGSTADTPFVELVRRVSGAPAFYARSPREEDLAELCCLGYMLTAVGEDPSALAEADRPARPVTLRLTYERGSTRATDDAEAERAYVDHICTPSQLAGVFLALLRMILPRARDLCERETTVRTAAARAVFPYPFIRDAQQEMITECWRDLRAGKILFAEAPTGIGKTISALYPAVRCLGEGRADKIFYLTAKNATRREAFLAMEKLVAAGTPLRAIVITARESVCLSEAARSSSTRLSAFCHPDACPYAKGHYDRVEAAIEDLLATGNGLFSGLTILAAARKWQVCPYELSLDLSERCEVIICDYNYAFDPAVSLRRYFSDGLPGTPGHRYLFLVDEAHNLPDRARDMYGALLTLRSLEAVQTTLHDYETNPARGAGIFPFEDGPDADDDRSPRLSSAALDDVIGAVGRLRGRCAEFMETGGDGVRRGVSLDHGEPTELITAVRRLVTTAERWLRRHAGHPLYGTVDGLAVSLRSFRTACDLRAGADESFVTFTEVEGDEVTVRLVCLDPAPLLRPILRAAVGSVLFSATLTPAAYFADVLGGDRNSLLVSFDSPFPRDHLRVAVCDRVSTRYEDREASYRRVVSYIAATVAAKRGNYLVYFPSYGYLEKVLELFRRKYPKVRTVVQTRGMSGAARDAFIAAFAESGGDAHTQVGFCVLGGSFSEGVDLPGNCLIGTVIVGVGIPGLSNERNIMREYFDRRDDGEVNEAVGPGGRGYAYAYLYPGMNRILQAAGRVIRRPEDRGVVVLIDDRYAAPPYPALFPTHWEDLAAVGDPASLNRYLTDFWCEGQEAGGAGS